jgi:hypothetical protein
MNTARLQVALEWSLALLALLVIPVLVVEIALAAQNCETLPAF